MKGMKRERGFTQLLRAGAGFTIIEALFCIAVLGAMIQVIYMTYEANYEIWESADTQAAVRQEATWAMEMITKYLQGTRGIFEAEQHYLSFWTDDYDQDGEYTAWHDPIVKFRWDQENRVLEIQPVGANPFQKFRKLADYAETFDLWYRDQNDVPLPSLPDGSVPEELLPNIRRITVHLVIEMQRGAGRGKESIELRSSISPRNLGHFPQPEYSPPPWE